MNTLRKNIHTAPNLFLKFILLLIVLCVFIPWSPKMPGSSLDSSWGVALNQAVIQGLSFGREIIFTLGPYSFIYTKIYHPALDNLMIGGSLYLALSYWGCLIFLMKGFRWYWWIIVGFFLFVMVYTRDTLLFTYPLVVGLICCKIISKENKPLPLPLLLFIPFGLLSLIKGSLLILCITTSILCFIFFIKNKRNDLAFISLAVPVISALLFWIGIGQSAPNLLHYVVNTISLASSFSEAMATQGNLYEIILYLINSVVLLIYIACQRQLGTKKIFVWCLYLVFLFMSFKAGFTRHFGHALIPGTSIVFATLFLPFILKSRAFLILLLFSLNTWYFMNGNYTHLSLANNFFSNYTAAWHGLKNRVEHPDWLKQDFNLSMDYLNTQASFPVWLGKTDIYSYNQSYLIASKNTWAPRPVFQSYSVFNERMATKNKLHLQEANSPDHIIFKIEPIDKRIPSLEDGCSWPVLLAQYEPLEIKNDFLFLKKRIFFNKVTEFKKQSSSEKHLFGESVNLSTQQHNVFVTLKIKPTILGRLSTMLLKPTPLEITVTLQNGVIKHYRIIASMAKSGFLLSPLIENTAEFAMLYNKSTELDKKIVRSMVISAHDSWLWNNEYFIDFKYIA